jgi:Dynamin central region
MECQSAYRLAQKADPEGLRTIGITLAILLAIVTSAGVLTKCDLLKDGQHETWFEILRNEKYPLLHGYYATKLRGAGAEESHSWDQVKDSEFKLFKSLPWNKLPLLYRGRLGTHNLKEVLSSSLAQMIDEKLAPIYCSADGRLPKLKDELVRKLRAVDEQLGQLPESLSENPQGLLLNLCRDFLADVEFRTKRNESHPQFFETLHEIFSLLQKRILATKLEFSVDFNDAAAPSSQIPVQQLAGQPLVGRPPSPMTPPTSPTSSRTLGDDTAGPKGIVSVPQADVSVFSLSFVRAVVKQKSIGLLPTVIDAGAPAYFIREFLSAWEILFLGAFDELEKALTEHLLDISNLHFDRFRSSRFHEAVK